VLSHLIPAIALIVYLSQYDVNDESGKIVPEKGILWAFAASVAAVFTFSAIYHLFMSACDKQWQYEVFLKTDVIGVDMSITAGLAIEIWMPLACYSGELKAAVILGIFIVSATGIYLS